MGHSLSYKCYSLNKLDEFSWIRKIHMNWFDIHFICKKSRPFFTLILFLINAKPTKSLLLIPMSTFSYLCSKFFHLIFSLLFASLDCKNWIRQSSFINISFLINKDCLDLRVGLQNRVNDVSFIKAVCHSYPALYDPWDFVIT